MEDEKMQNVKANPERLAAAMELLQYMAAQARKNSNNGELFDPLVFVSDLDKVFIVAGIPLEKEVEAI